jgi:hypothetical protein
VAAAAPVVSTFGYRISFGLGISALRLIGLIMLKGSKNHIFYAALAAG